MKLKDLMDTLLDYNPEAEVVVIANNAAQSFTLTWGGGDCCTKKQAETVSFYVDALNQGERRE